MVIVVRLVQRANKNAGMLSTFSPMLMVVNAEQPKKGSHPLNEPISKPISKEALISSKCVELKFTVVSPVQLENALQPMAVTE